MVDSAYPLTKRFLLTEIKKEFLHVILYEIHSNAIVSVKNLLRVYYVVKYEMSHNKKEIEIPGESTEEVKELELDEQPKPTRKVSHPATPMSNKEEPSTHDKIKGRRTIK
jgi:hypothetical protein